MGKPYSAETSFKLGRAERRVSLAGGLSVGEGQHWWSQTRRWSQERKEPVSETNGKHPGGRPSKYEPVFCDRIIACGKVGDSRTQMAAKLGIARETLNNWGKAHPEFLAALKRADTLSQSWWEDRLREIAVTGKGNVTAVIFAMKNRFKADWQERYVSEQTAYVEHDVNELTELIERKLALIVGRGRGPTPA